MRFKGLDLNILQALDVLLEERHVSRAAERLNVTQPAMSGILTRREYFNDPLLVQHGKRMIPTAHALALIPKLKLVLGEIDVLVAQLSRFDIATSERTFKVIASDYVVSLLFKGLAGNLTQVGPNISIAFSSPTFTTVRQFEHGEIDLLITPEYLYQGDNKGHLLYEEEQVLVGWSGNPLLKSGRVSYEDFFNSSHIIVELGGVNVLSYVEQYMRHISDKRKIAMRVPSFIAALGLVVETDLLTITHKSLALAHAKNYDISIVPLPLDIPPMKQLLACHEARRSDPGVQWLMGEITKAGAFIDEL